MAFPTNPTNGQQATVNGVVYTYDSTLTAWAVGTEPGGNVSGNVLNITSTAAIGSTLSATGTITGGNLVTGGAVSSTGTVTGGNLVTGGAVSSTGTVTGGNLVTGGAVSSTGTVTGGNLVTGGTASVTGNITGGNLVTGGTASVTGNITGGNLTTGGTASASGTITGGNLTTGGTLSVTGLTTLGANLTVTGHSLPSANATYDLGSTSARWRNIYTNDLQLNNGIGDYTIVEGEDDLFLYNNKKGKVYKFALIEVDPAIAPPKAKTD